MTFLSSIQLYVNQEIIIVLSIALVIFAVLLIVGIRKSYKLKKENERLFKISEKLTEPREENYKDFTDGHMYQ